MPMNSVFFYFFAEVDSDTFQKINFGQSCALDGKFQLSTFNY